LRGALRALTGRAFTRAANLAVLLAAVVGITVVVNLAVSAHDLRFDLSGGDMYTPSPQTVTVMESLDADVHAIAFTTGNGVMDTELTDLLDEYSRLSPHFSYEMVDPDRNPSVARRYGVTKYGTIVLESGDRTQMLYAYDLFQQGISPETLVFTGEESVTRAIVELTGETRGVVAFLEGHGEKTPVMSFQWLEGQLKGEGYEVDSINLAREGSVPEDVDILVMAGPTKDLDAREFDELESFVESGGRLFVMVDPLPGKSLPRLEELLSRWGVELQDDVVVDPQRAYFLDALSPAPYYNWHDITKELINRKLGVMLPRARSLELTKARVDGVAAQSLLRTSNGSWGETNMEAREASRDDEDVPGPLTLALAVTSPTHATGAGTGSGQAQASDKGEGEQESAGEDEGEPEAGPVMVVMGDSSFIETEWASFQGNADFFMNVIGWLSHEESTITIRPRVRTLERVFLTPTDVRKIFWGTVVALPVAVLAVGAGIWIRRRRS